MKGMFYDNVLVNWHKLTMIRQQSKLSKLINIMNSEGCREEESFAVHAQFI